MTNDDSPKTQVESRVGLLVAGAFGALGLSLVALTTPFLLPALRKHCLPYVPATDEQLANLTKAFKKHKSPSGTFLDVGSGDGRIVRLAAKLDLYSQVHGVELNSWLVLYSRAQSFWQPNVKYHKQDLWKFPLGNYDTICIFGVDTMMSPLEKYLRESARKRSREQTVFACRFPFRDLEQIDEIGQGIDTVWVYKLQCNKA